MIIKIGVVLEIPPKKQSIRNFRKIIKELKEIKIWEF